MRAVLRDVSAYGKSEVFSVVENVPTTEWFASMQSKDILVKVSYAGVNPAEYKVAQGSVTMLETSKNIIPGKRIPGADYCGVVEKVGDQVTKFKVGDVVLGNLPDPSIFAGNGCWGEYTVTSENYPVKKPDEMPEDVAAALPMIGITSMIAIKSYMKLKPEHKLLVIGGSSGTGSMAIQLAKAYGVSTIAATCSTKNIDLVKSYGADVVIDYTTTNWWDALAGKDYDVIYDCIGGKGHWVNSHKVLKPWWGKFTAVVPDDPDVRLGVGVMCGMLGSMVNRGWWSMFGYPSYSMVMGGSNSAYLEELCKLYQEKKLKVVIDSVFPLTTEGVRAAVDKVSGGHTSGKVVLKVI